MTIALTRSRLLARGFALLAVGGAAATLDAAPAAADGQLRLRGSFAALRDERVRYAELRDPRGKRAGALYVHELPVLGELGGVIRIEQQTLVLPAGTLVAHGAVRGSEGELAIVGGTGGYAGRRGHVAARYTAHSVDVDITLES